ncbi:hypothetical protein IV454_29680 [Massilia antarctica]|uniref:Uncharacterized protein n=1 Tax=Massilia antarctica TaxID=2765360 RepID=A0AA48WDP3_9BURK|nr:hypothetical protein [Massilia antarctica]QPI49554.1 hypothetical protein IV454_29680 [Massilia antarctica]
MSTERFAHFLDSLQSWSAEAPAPAAAPATSPSQTNANQSARVRRVKGLLEAVGSDPTWRARGDTEAGNDSAARNADERDDDLDDDLDDEDEDFN